MNTYIKEILSNYQVRKTKHQKKLFITWLENELKEMDYKFQKDVYSKTGTNIVVGDVEKSKVILTAHYDTQPNSIFPIFTGFSNWFSFIISQLLSLYPIIIMVTLYFLITYLLTGSASINLFVVSVFLLLYAFQISEGFANIHTANDNTSGVITLLSILTKIPRNQRDLISVVFFDEEELGLVGSKYFKQSYKEVIMDKPLLNFDCVGDGDHISIIIKKNLDASFYTLLQQSFNEGFSNTFKKLRFGTALNNIYMSDQLRFKQGVGIVASSKLPIFGYYLSRIHSKWDTNLDTKNVDLITNSTLILINKIEKLES